MGDPTGVGPEIIVKALTNYEPRSEQTDKNRAPVAAVSISEHCDAIVIGRPSILRKAASVSGIECDVVEVTSTSDWIERISGEPGSSPISSSDKPSHTIINAANTNRPLIYCLPAGNSEADLATEPKIDARGGQAAYDCLVAAAQLALGGSVDAIVTAPLQKVSLHMAGHDWPGHTELLADLCGVDEHAMMLYLPPGRPRHGGDAGFGVVHVTLHMALREVFSNLSIAAVFEKIRLANTVFARIRSAMQLDGLPKIAVAALNPHGGEGGRFGDEESTIIAPAVRSGQEAGIDVVGPLPVDTLMPAAVDGKFDAVVAMYHDQGHIALKLLDMFDAVNITLGLPILRTSVAHGTAHDIAWQDRAQHSGMIQAILTAARLAPVRTLASTST